MEESCDPFFKGVYEFFQSSDYKRIISMEQSQIFWAIFFFVQLFVYALIVTKVSDIFFKHIQAKYGLQIAMWIHRQKEEIQKMFDEQERLIQESKQLETKNVS